MPILAPVYNGHREPLTTKPLYRGHRFPVAVINWVVRWY
ncbi:hypothetical protein OKW42_003618 [Paraburkholderia sp. WC7.3d]